MDAATSLTFIIKEAIESSLVSTVGIWHLLIVDVARCSAVSCELAVRAESFSATTYDSTVLLYCTVCNETNGCILRHTPYFRYVIP